MADARSQSQDRWVSVVGYLLCTVVLTAGYYYTLTFVQLGIIDLGVHLVGMDYTTVSMAMAVLAVLTTCVAIYSGVALDRRGWNTALFVKLWLLFGVVVMQCLLTAVAPSIGSPLGFWIWLLLCALPLGIGIPVTFSFMLTLVPRHHRGYVAAIIAGLSFFLAAIYPLEWNIRTFSTVMATAMIPAIGVLGGVLYTRLQILKDLSRSQHKSDPGRFVRSTPPSVRSAPFLVPLLLMFGVFFIDSLGFLRIIDTPAYILSSWQSTDLTVRLFIAGVHVIGAGIAGILYTNFDRNWLFFWVFALFAFTHLQYVLHLRLAPTLTPPLALPLFYVLAVSFYTTLNFALWADLLTLSTVGTHTAVGIGIAGWLATFCSTAVALYSTAIGLSLFDHLIYVHALALLFAVALPIGLYVRTAVHLSQVEQHP